MSAQLVATVQVFALNTSVVCPEETFGNSKRSLISTVKVLRYAHGGRLVWEFHGVRLTLAGVPAKRAHSEARRISPESAEMLAELIRPLL